MKNTKTETRTYLNPRHKAVQLNKKDGRLFFFYCVDKGKETNRYYSKDNFEHENYFRLCFSINGYFAFVELEDEYTNNTEVLDLIKEECQKKLKYYEVPETIKELEKIPHKDNGGKVDYLLLEEMANNEEYVKVLK